MIDFTTIQANAIHSTLSSLTNKNVEIKSENSELKNVLMFFAIGGVVCLGFYIYAKYKENERRNEI